MGRLQVHQGLTRLQERCGDLDFAEPVICARATNTARDSPAMLGSLGEAAEETDGPECQGEARGQSRGQENQRTSENTVRWEALPGPEEGKGRRGLEEGRVRQEGMVKGQGQM